jgi:hypothetical protein
MSVDEHRVITGFYLIMLCGNPVLIYSLKSSEKSGE